MAEQNFYIDLPDPNVIHGVNDSNINTIKQYFPKLKIVLRGEMIKVAGDPLQIEVFDKKLQAIFRYYNQFHKITPDILKEILTADPDAEEELFGQDKNILLYNTRGKPIRGRTPNQKRMTEMCKTNDLIIAVGPAGTGKTYTAIALAVKALKEKQVKRIILSRPAVEAGENLGFLPGDLREKLDPYLQPLYDALLDMIPYKKLERLIEEKIIQIAPLAFMRGRTLSEAFAILDEAQNATNKQLKMFLTRMGENSKFIINGDITQIDLPGKHKSGLPIAMRILSDIKGVAQIKMGQEDIIRHRLVNSIVDAYENNEKSNNHDAYNQ